MPSPRIVALPLLLATLLAGLSGCATSTVTAAPDAASQTKHPYAQTHITRQVTIRLDDDHSISPAWFKATEGDAVRLIIVNEGNLPHAFSVGSEDTLKKRIARFARAAPLLQDRSNTVDIGPHQRTELTLQLRSTSRVYYTCVEFGPYDDATSGYIAVARPPPAGHPRRARGS